MTGVRSEGLSGSPGQPLRIVVTALWYHPEHPSGSSRLAWDEARYLAALGHDVWLVAMDGGAGEPEHVVEAGVHVLRYRRPRWAGVDPTGRHVRVIERLLRRHLGTGVDVVHGHMLLPTIAALDLYGARARTCYSLHSPVRAELMAARRGAALLERLRLRVAAAVRSRTEARVLAQSEVVTCDSAFARSLVREIHGAVVADRMRVMPGWVDLARFAIIEDRVAAKRALGWPTDRPVLFCLRRFVPRMGLDSLVAAAADLRSSGGAFHLVMAGDGPLRPGLVQRARQLGLAESVDFPGGVSDGQLPVMFGAADAFVLPTAQLECFGLIAIEALACGRPVLATPAGAIPETLGAIEPRWLAKDTSAKAIADLVGAHLAGRLPSRQPRVLREFVERAFADVTRLPALAALAVTRTSEA
jgi:glycosyltransferase involved in cell wall biosynthesis